MLSSLETYSFNATSNEFIRGNTKYRKTKLGTILYLASLEETKEVFEKYFDIIKAEILEVPGKPGNHKANYILMKKIENK